MNSPTAPTARRWTLPITVGGLLLLGALCLRHPGLRLVDFLGFSARGLRLLDGDDLVHPLYPVGYPAVLGLLQASPVSPILAGRVLSLGAAAVALVAATRWLGPAAGIWLLVQPAFLTYGATEGTDLPAFAAGLAALALRASHRPALAGLSVGCAALIRYTSAALLPLVLWPPRNTENPRRSIGIVLGGFTLATMPHWATALVTGAPILPDQSSNFAIGANAVVTGLGLDTLRRLPNGLSAALPFVFSGPGVALGTVALVASAAWAWKRRRPDRLDIPLRLGGWAVAHLLLVATAFANVRLVLPTRLALALGAAVLLRRRPAVLGGLAVVLGVWTVPAAWSVSPGERNLAAVVQLLEGLEGPLRSGHFLTTDPWVHRRMGRHFQAGTPVREAGGDPRRLDAQQLAAFARARGDLLVVVDVGRVHRTYPGLSPLLDTPEVASGAGLHPVGRSPGYRVFAVQEPP